jgi:hypothetical protein
VRIALVLLLASMFVACTQPRSETCKTVCTTEYACITQTNSNILFDEKECIAACSVLEGDPDNLAKVHKHADCIARHNTSCAQLLECE